MNRAPSPQKRMPACLAAALLCGWTPAIAQQAVDASFAARAAEPAFVENHPVVRIDEAHFNVHTASGSYKPFADLISSDGCRVEAHAEPFSRESLEGCDILVIANARGAARPADPAVARPAFTEAECDAVRDWVGAGGALLLISDHWPIGSAMECLAQRFGVEMSKGRTLDPANRDSMRLSMSRLVFSRENGLLLDCPITRGRNESERIDRFETFSGQSLRGPEGCMAFLRLGDTAYDEIPTSPGLRMSARGRSQGLALFFGQGRVVAMGEASCLSAQTTAARQPRRRGAPAGPAPVAPARMAMGMNAEGTDNVQMALNIVRWLAGLLDPPPHAPPG